MTANARRPWHDRYGLWSFGWRQTAHRSLSRRRHWQMKFLNERERRWELQSNAVNSAWMGRYDYTGLKSARILYFSASHNVISPLHCTHTDPPAHDTHTTHKTKYVHGSILQRHALYMGPNFLTQPDPTQCPTMSNPTHEYLRRTRTDPTRPKPKAVLQLIIISTNVDYWSAGLCTLKSRRICGIKVKIA